MVTTIAALVASLFVASASAHGNITSPPARLTGPAMVQACGQAAVNSILSDGTLPLESVSRPLATCKLDLCRGAVFQDNVNRVQTFTPGQIVNMAAILPIPHEGPMNVSIVKTATNKILGNALIVFDSYADENLPQLPANNTKFSVTIPNNLAATDCKVAGECVLQWFWFGTGAQQTYESCVDFVMGGAAAAKPATGAGSATAPGRTSGLAPVGKASGVASAAPVVPAVAPVVPAVAPVIPAVAPVVPAAPAVAISQEGVVGGVVSSIPIEQAAPLPKRN